MTATMILGVDTGGTFTDFVLYNKATLTIHKVLSTPAAPEQAILQGIDELSLWPAIKAGQLMVIHGSTVATNAALEGKGVKTAFITNDGLQDMLTIGRQTRRELYSLTPTAPQAPVPAELCLGTGGRLSHQGETLVPLTSDDIATLQQQLAELKPEAVAINLLYSYLDDQAEQQLEQALAKDYFVSRSSAVLPEYKEYERGIATWLNAWLGPLVERYLQRLNDALTPSRVAVMQSHGGTIAIEQAGRQAVNMLLSGPAGGLAAALYMGRHVGNNRLITFDMGGTSTDVSLLDNRIQLTTEGRIKDYPVATPMVDMHTIGAGGGSIAYIDAGGVLQVGPESAGAFPGPACYGQGGSRATVTDANAVLGRLRPDAFLGGTMSLDIDAAEAAIQPLADQLELSLIQTAQGIIDIANEHMARALRAISIQRGYSPNDFTLCCFGGAGGLHLCALAESLGMQRAMVPLHGGVLSALGMLVAPPQRQLSQTCQALLGECNEAELDQRFKTLAKQGYQQLADEGLSQQQINEQRSVELRYQGQSFTLNVPWENPQQAEQAFHQLHRQRYSHALSAPVELVTLRVSLQGETLSLALPDQIAATEETGSTVTLPGIQQAVRITPREQLPIDQPLSGPLLITERISTTLVAEGWEVSRDHVGNLHLQRQNQV